MWVAATIAASFLAAAAGWHLVEFFWNRRLFDHTSESEFTKNIGAKRARQLLHELPGMITVDVRPAKKFASRHLPRAVNAPFADGKLNASALDATAKETPILVYCDGGYRSRKALPGIKKLGFKSIYHLHRGILSWKLRGGTDASEQPAVP